MPWGVHSEYTGDEDQTPEIDEDQTDVDRAEEGEERTEAFDVDEALSRLE